jgi:hypothetical protein
MLDIAPVPRLTEVVISGKKEKKESEMQRKPC